jgi:hypothetical protein
VKQFYTDLFFWDERQTFFYKKRFTGRDLFGMTGDMRSATSGKGSYFVKSQSFEQLPREMQEKIIKQIRDRKGLSENQ